MNRRAVITALSLAPLARARPSAAAERKRFIGVWKLVSGVSTDEVTGEVRYPWGKNPVGRLSYDEAGRVFAQLMNPDRRSVGGVSDRGAAAAIAAASADDMREMLTGFNAYFGTFDVDEPSRTVIHHLQSALIPSWVGTTSGGSTSFSDTISSLFSIPQARLLTGWCGIAKERHRKMKRTILTLAFLMMAVGAVPAGYEHWSAELFAAHEKALHQSLKNGLASETLGNWGNHLLLKTRREASSGQAELHEKQADLIVVQSGHAAIVIGGRIRNGQTTAPNEIRGTSINGGERQLLKAGDVLHISAKTPHQVLLDPGQTLDYIVLKVDSQ